MTWTELETIFNRALRFTFSRKKVLFLVPILIFCGLIVVLCRALAEHASDWMAMSLTFLPIFFCATIFLTAGIILIRIYHDEVKQIHLSYRKTIRDSMGLMVKVAYFCMPIVLAYMFLWTILGFFYLLKAIPAVGSFLGVVLSFGHFLLLLGSFVLSLVSLLMLFYLTPVVSLKSTAELEVLEGILKRFLFSPFSNCALFVLSLIPLCFIVTFMILAAVMTENNYFVAEQSFASAAQCFFIMLPFSALLAPAVIFFFNFSAESFVFIQRKSKASILKLSQNLADRQD